MHAASFEGESFSPRKMLQLVHFGEILICSDHASVQISIGYTCPKPWRIRSVTFGKQSAIALESLKRTPPQVNCADRECASSSTHSPSRFSSCFSRSPASYLREMKSHACF